VAIPKEEPRTPKTGVRADDPQGVTVNSALELTVGSSSEEDPARGRRGDTVAKNPPPIDTAPSRQELPLSVYKRGRPRSSFPSC
jgi:hypothetical protein